MLKRLLSGRNKILTSNTYLLPVIQNLDIIPKLVTEGERCNVKTQNPLTTHRKFDLKRLDEITNSMRARVSDC